MISPNKIAKVEPALREVGPGPTSHGLIFGGFVIILT